LPESPRWLLAKGRLEEAKKILHNLAHTNGKELPHIFCDKIQKQIEHQQCHTDIDKNFGPNIFSLFKTPNMRLKTFLITLNW
jgi:OCT family organic cation transporter-like MFS transporter 4/5